MEKCRGRNRTPPEKGMEYRCGGRSAKPGYDVDWRSDHFAAATRVPERRPAFRWPTRRPSSYTTEPVARMESAYTSVPHQRQGRRHETLFKAAVYLSKACTIDVNCTYVKTTCALLLSVHSHSPLVLDPAGFRVECHSPPKMCSF